MAFLASNFVPNPTNADVVDAGHTSTELMPNNPATSSAIDCLWSGSSKSRASPVPSSRRGTSPVTKRYHLYPFSVERGTVRLQRQQRVAVRLRRLQGEGVFELGNVAEVVVVLERLRQEVDVADRRDYPSIYRVE